MVRKRSKQVRKEKPLEFPPRIKIFLLLPAAGIEPTTSWFGASLRIPVRSRPPNQYNQYISCILLYSPQTNFISLILISFHAFSSDLSGSLSSFILALEVFSTSSEWPFSLSPSPPPVCSAGPPSPLHPSRSTLPSPIPVVYLYSHLP